MSDNFYLERLETLSNKIQKGESVSEIRSEMQDIVSCANAELSEKHEICREVILKILRMLRKIRNGETEPCEKLYMCELTELFDNLTFCCEMLCAEYGKRIFFTCEDDAIYTLCSPRDLSWAFLNVLANAVMYSSGSYIGVNLTRDGKSARLDVINEGNFDFDSFLTGITEKDGGLFRASEIAKAHGGAVVMTSFSGKADVSFHIPVKERFDKPEYKIPAAEDLLYDRFSIVYTALSGI